MGAHSDLLRVLVPFGVPLELIEVENLVRKIRLHQNIDIKVHISEHAVHELGRHINIAVIQSNLPIVGQELKNVIPTPEPIIFDGPRSSSDPSECLMLYFNLKLGVEHDERPLLPSEKCIPAAILLTVKFQNSNIDLRGQVYGLENAPSIGSPRCRQQVEGRHPQGLTNESCAGGLHSLS